MARSTIKVSVDPDTADIFAGATAEEKDKLSLLWSVLLHEYKSCPKPLKKLIKIYEGMSSTSRKLLLTMASKMAKQ